MLPPLLPLLLVLGLTSAANLPSEQTDNLLDSILEEAGHLISVNRQLPSVDLSLSPLLDVSLVVAPATIRGPTTLDRFGNAEGFQEYERGRLSGLVKLGQVQANLPSVQVRLFGHVLSTQLLTTIQDAYSPIQIDVYRDNLATCQVSVQVMPPRGTRTIHFGQQQGPAKLFTGVLEFVIFYILDYIPLLSNAFELFSGLSFSDITHHMERQLTIAARRIAC